MSGRNFRQMSNDEVFARWQERFTRIMTELHYLFSTRRKFYDIQEMFRTNKRLHNIGNQPYRWILGIWGRDAVMAVRRELDDDRNTIAFGTLLDEMVERPTVLTRERFLSFLKDKPQFLLEPNNRAFDRWGVVSRSGGPQEDYLNPEGIRNDRKSLDAAAAPVLEYANRLVAHRTPIDELNVTVDQINTAIDALEPVVKKYHVIVTGSALVQIEPINQGDDWKECFTFPWYIREREPEM